MTLLETMAKAAFEVELHPGAYDDLEHAGRMIMLRRMRAALTAGREPTTAMMHAEFKHRMTPYAAEEGAATWTRMVDAALEEK